MNGDGVLDYLDVLAWPLLILILIGAFLWLYRGSIAGLIGRISVIRTPVGSVRAVTEEQPKEAPPLPKVDQPPPSEDPSTPSPAPTATEQQLSAYVYYWYYEKMYRQTYGSQTRLLESLNKSPAGTDAVTLLPFLLDHLREAQAMSPTYDRSITDYIGWLETALFVTQQGGNYQITALGKSFLQWMVAEGLSHKPGL